MDSMNLIEEKIARVADLLEQISDVDRVIAVYEKDEVGIMKSQYLRRRNQFLNELKLLLGELNIRPDDLIAA